MPYKLYIGDTSDQVITFKDFKDVIGETDAHKVSLVGGKTEIRRMVDPSTYPLTAQQRWEEFTARGVRFYMLELASPKQVTATQEKLDQSTLPLIFFVGTHGSGDPP